MEKSIQLYSKGVHNLLDSEIIPTEAASDSLNWFTQDGRIKLVNGKERIGQAGVAGKITGEIFGYKADSTKVHFKKAGTKIQYLSGTTWTDIITEKPPNMASDVEPQFCLIRSALYLSNDNRRENY